MASNPPDAAASFAKGLDGIAERLGQGEYRQCLRRTMDLTRFSWLLGQDDWVFLCEVLESVHANMADLAERGAIPGDAEAGIRERLQEDMRRVIESAKGGDEAGKYRALRKIRADATAFQLDTLASHPGGAMA